jgi:hypothetical protein
VSVLELLFFAFFKFAIVGMTLFLIACLGPYFGGGGAVMILVLDSVTSTPQWIRQPRPRVYL